MAKELCQFSKVCRGYHKEAFTCHDTEAKWYCGYYKEHLKFKLIASMDRMLEGCDFADVTKI